MLMQPLLAIYIYLYILIYMKNLKKIKLKLISMNIPEELYQELKVICDKRGMTMTMYILRALVARMDMEKRSE